RCSPSCARSNARRWHAPCARSPPASARAPPEPRGRAPVTRVRPRPLLIFPLNGNGLEALDCLGEDWELAGFVDDTPEKQGRSPWGRPVLRREALRARPDAAVLAVPGSPTSYRERRKLIEGLGVAPERFARVIHPQ